MFSIETKDKRNDQMKQKVGLTATTPCLVYFVEATYEYFTVSTTAFIRFLAAWINDVALSNCKKKKLNVSRPEADFHKNTHPGHN